MKLRNKKTGKVIDLDYWNLHTFGNEIILELFNGEEYYCYESLAKLNKDWEGAEDINVTNIPCIKDEEIREIIRAWANVNDAMVLKYNRDENSLNDIYRNEITFNMGLGLKDGEKYTIAELCGEEE